MKKIVFIILAILYSLNSNSQILTNPTDDNRKYYYDLGISYSTLIFSGEGSMINLQGAYYLSPNLGLRTGLSYSSNITDDCNWMVKVPILFSFRTSTIDGGYFDLNNDSEDQTIGAIIINVLVNILPKRFELNIGPAIGYINPYKELGNIEKSNSESNLINTKMMFSLDANAKMTFPIKRFGIDLSFGVSYLATNNIKHYKYDKLDYKYDRWIGNFTLGAHYRF